jgi:ribosomal protein S18 acetylase RimI-like enzyme
MSSTRSQPTYELRSARQEDADFLWQLRQAALRPHVEKTWGKWDDVQQRKFFDRGFVPRETRIIMFDGQAAGRLDVSRSRLDFFLGLIEILPEVQGRGLGSAVVRDLQEEARTKRVPIRLQVIKGNEAAVRLYARLDFKPAGETKTHQLMLWQP